MAITVVCQGCHTRFKVSEKFAGRKGPCPKCKIEIYIPKVEERVQIKHEHSEEHVRGASGKLVLEPIAREEFTFKPWMIGLIAGLTLGAFVAAFFRPHLSVQTSPWSIMASATFRKPAMLAPLT